MVMFTRCGGCMIGDHDKHAEIVIHPPKGGVGGARCNCPGPETCKPESERNAVRLLRSLFPPDGDPRIRPAAPSGGSES